MPIDYEAIVAPFRTAYFLQRRSIIESFRKLAEWLSKRLRETQERERATGAFPSFGFRGEALSVWIDPSQHGAFGPQGDPPPSGFWAGAAAPFVALWNGLLLAPTMIEAEGVLPALLDTLVRTFRLIKESVDRFRKPEKSLFDLTTKKRWDDLFGEIGLFFRLVNDPETVKQITRFSEGGISLIRVLRKQFPSEPEAEKTAMSLGDVAKWVLGGTLAIPIAWDLLTGVVKTLSFKIRLDILDRASAIQREVFGIRRKAIDFLFVTLFGIGSRAVEWLVITKAETLATIDLYKRFVGQYLTEIRDWIVTTSKAIKTFADDLLAFIRGFGDYLEGFLDVDFGEAVTYRLMSFKVSEILEWRDNPDKAKERQKQIDDLIEDHPVLTYLVRERLRALREVIGIAATKTPFPAEAAPPDLSGVTFPNIAESFLGEKDKPSPAAKAFRDAMAAAGPKLTTSVDSLFNATIKALTDSGDAMAKAGTAAARIGSAARYRAVANQAETFSETAFGANAARAKLRRKDPIAEAFESWLAGSGFTLIGRALPKYVAEMIEFWKRESSRPPAERPTSPQILARRARVGRIRLPRMVIRVNEERDLDKGLAVEIADRTGIGVAQAYQLAIAQPGVAG